MYRQFLKGIVYPLVVKAQIQVSSSRRVRYSVVQLDPFLSLRGALSLALLYILLLEEKHTAASDVIAQKRGPISARATRTLGLF